LCTGGLTSGRKLPVHVLIERREDRMRIRDGVVFVALLMTWLACQGPREHALGVGPGLGPIDPSNPGAPGLAPDASSVLASDGARPPAMEAGTSAPGTPASNKDGAMAGSDGPTPSIGNQAAADGPLADSALPAPSAVCGNNIVESGEECDPISSCPSNCPNQGCTRFALQGSPAQCSARCVEMGKETACKNGDGCCPATCNATNDNDCSVKCDNGIKEAQETCDPLATCPTACPAQGCQLRKLVNEGTCTAACVNDRQQTACLSGDGCCPSACNGTNDNDCKPRCGNGVVETGETCDPVASCQSQQTACRDDNATIRRPTGDPTKCTFACQQSARTCAAASDGICPTGCTPSNDADCKKNTGDSCGTGGECKTGFCV
jgi:hypothetical protein